MSFKKELKIAPGEEFLSTRVSLSNRPPVHKNIEPEYTVRVCGDSEDEKESLNKLSFILGFMTGSGIVTLINVIILSN